jgi:GntR family galactonate operon transcriptional repressor
VIALLKSALGDRETNQIKGIRCIWASNMQVTKTLQMTRVLGRQIAHRRYAPGSPLPTELELCEQFETSRNVVREAVRVLSTKRLIDAQRHRGLYVMPAEQWNYLDADVLEWVLENGVDTSLVRCLLEARSLIEPPVSRWAAERATSFDLLGIETNVNRMEANLNTLSAFHEADIQFHRAVLVASHNVVMQQMSDAIGALQRAIFDFTFQTEPEHMKLTVKEHHDLFDAIRRKNPEAAEEASRRMIVRTQTRALQALASIEGAQMGIAYR